MAESRHRFLLLLKFENLIILKKIVTLLFNRNNRTRMKKSNIAKYLYWIIIILILFPYKEVFALENSPISSAVALFIGLLFAFIFGTPQASFNKKISKYLLQASVVGLGFGMNLEKSISSGSEGMLFTIISVVGVMIIGVLIGRCLHIDRKTSYLISSGTAICGGSAIAAVGGVIKANSNQMAVSLGVVFVLNAIALFIFPPIGELLNMSQEEFGTWAAIAIHDTSSVVGAGQAFGDEACELATLIKCTRALWIIPLALATIYFFKDGRDSNTKTKIAIPWFIILFVLAMLINTYTPASVADQFQPIYEGIVYLAKKALILVLFAIGAGLSITNIKQVGFKPLIQAVVLWLIIGVSSLIVIMTTI